MIKNIEKHPFIMIVVGVLGISLSSILVRYSSGPSVLTAAWRLLWTVVLMTPVVLGKQSVRHEIRAMDRKSVFLCISSGLFLAAHFAVWFESLRHTSVASSTTIVCTEVIWVSLGYCLFLKGHLSRKALLAIAVAFGGSVLIALSDTAAGETHFYGDVLALIAAVAVAGYTLIGRLVRASVSTTAYTYIVYVSCCVVLTGYCITGGYGFFDYGVSCIIVGLLLALFSTILGHSIFSWCLKYFSPSFVSASKLCEPVAAAAMAAVLFGEAMTAMQVMGGILILGSVLFYSRMEHQGEN